MTIHVMKAADGTTAPRASEPIFEGGEVWSKELATAQNGRDMRVTAVHFAPGARARMHRHSSDQVLYVLNGLGKVGDAEGEHVIAPGDCVVIPADTDHWHGAGDTGSPMTHLSITRGDSQTTVL
jgi:4-carboxymuconolactone decarboxylase